MTNKPLSERLERVYRLQADKSYQFAAIISGRRVRIVEDK